MRKCSMRAINEGKTKIKKQASWQQPSQVKKCRISKQQKAIAVTCNLKISIFFVQKNNFVTVTFKIRPIL